jgi:hypothetical protein
MAAPERFAKRQIRLLHRGLPIRDVRYSVAIEGKADVPRAVANRRE